MKLKNIMIESKDMDLDSVIYITSLSNAIKIIKYNKLKTNKSLKDVHKPVLITVSDVNFFKRPENSQYITPSADQIMIILDGKKLSEEYKVIDYDLGNENSLEDNEQLWYGRTLVRHGGFKDIKKYIKEIKLTRGLISDIFDKKLYFNNTIIDEFGSEDEFNKDKKKSVLDIKKWFENKGLKVTIK